MNSQIFKNLFTQAKDLMQTTKDANHDWEHVTRVMNRALEIKNLLSPKQQEG